ncbi:histidine triad nucleotide-binding protein [Heliophilum fasciatum]|uniref:Histidine triad (HIT) family protein n=1 Tax=Heliophilum fasciatum TaxID=35700 RepID=A0A4R2RYM9_9FIRM|nr:histidine triad nucleotide-binding protein [Heliophilum fasciatum]MCW2278135.1 histidine triad (HIT) family protein [Heliophilum fasciatum]TCP64205.1 histidine triad (HIT) family protein [Heliophilum fasciatum]
MDSCIFCKIVRGEIPANKVFENDRIVAFRDLNPVAPTHILIIPREHIASVSAATADHEATLGALLLAARTIAAEQGLEANGYRLVINTGNDAGQTVFHIHVHLLAGRYLEWPPG